MKFTNDNGLTYEVLAVYFGSDKHENWAVLERNDQFIVAHGFSSDLGGSWDYGHYFMNDNVRAMEYFAETIKDMEVTC